VNERPLLDVGIDRVAFAAPCYFTLVPVGVVGLSAITGYLGYVLLPALIFFIGVHAFGRRQQRLTRS
jgi:mercuric ion transport protein